MTKVTPKPIEFINNTPICECYEDWNGCPLEECGARPRISADGVYNPFFYKKWYCGEIPCRHVIAQHLDPKCPVRWGHRCRCDWDKEDWAELREEESL